MAGSFTNWLAAETLDTIFGQSSTELSTGGATIANISFCLWNSTGASVGETMTGATTGECAGSTYDRINLANSSANWANSTAADPATKQLKTAVTMTTSAGSDWGTVGYIVLCTSSGSGGQVLVWSTIDGGTVTINSGDTVTVTTDLTITLD